MGRAVYKVEGGKLIKVVLTQKDGKIEHIKITGDFFLHPEELIEEMERMLIGSRVKEEEINRSIREFIEKRGATLLGATPEDFARCIMMAVGQDG